MCDVYTHGLVPCAVCTGLYINTFPRHGYSMTFLLLEPSVAQTPSHLLGSIYFFSPYSCYFVWGIIFAMARLAADSMRYPVSLPSTPFISVPFLPFRYFSSNSKGKRNRQSSFVLRRSHEGAEKDEGEEALQEWMETSCGGCWRTFLQIFSIQRSTFIIIGSGG